MSTPAQARRERRLRTLEESRVKIDITKCFNRLQEIMDELSKVRGAEPIELSSNTIGALRLDSEIQFGLLKKILPDLKQVDMNLFQPDEPREVSEVLNDINDLVGSRPELAPIVAGIIGSIAADADSDVSH